MPRKNDHPKYRRRPVATLESLIARLRPIGPCLEWSDCKDDHGYGRLRHRGKDTKAHRLAWELANGPIPFGMFVLHRCDNPPCCNPAHLFVGTQADNAQDMMNKGRCRSRGGRGELAGTAKLTSEQVVTIRASVEPSTSIAAKFGVTPGHIRAIRRRKAWAHIENACCHQRPDGSVAIDRRVG